MHVQYVLAKNPNEDKDKRKAIAKQFDAVITRACKESVLAAKGVEMACKPDIIAKLKNCIFSSKMGGEAQTHFEHLGDVPIDEMKKRIVQKDQGMATENFNQTNALEKKLW